jgi:lipase chaperone LimK
MSASLQAQGSAGMARTAKLIGMGTLGAVLVAGVAWKLACGDCLDSRSQATPAAGPSVIGLAAEPAAAASAAQAGATGTAADRPLAQIEQALFAKGSLRGTEAPPWGVGRDQPLKPNRALRDRFDYYLLALGEASLSELTALVSAHAERDLGPKTAAEVMQVWARYLQLQQHAFQVVARPDDPLSMQAALQEHRQVRQSLLGMHWAEAFYGDEEKQLSHDIEQKLKGASARPVDAERTLMMAPSAGADPQALFRQRSEKFGAQAAQRLAELDREEAEWARRVAAAQAKVQELKQSPQLSDPQRAAAIRQYLDGAFPEPSERLRAAGLVGE